MSNLENDKQAGNETSNLLGATFSQSSLNLVREAFSQGINSAKPFLPALDLVKTSPVGNVRQPVISAGKTDSGLSVITNQGELGEGYRSAESSDTNARLINFDEIEAPIRIKPGPRNPQWQLRSDAPRTKVGIEPTREKSTALDANSNQPKPTLPDEEFVSVSNAQTVLPDSPIGAGEDLPAAPSRNELSSNAVTNPTIPVDSYAAPLDAEEFPSKPNPSATDLARLDHITAQAFNNRNERPGLPNSGLPNKTDPPKTVLASEEFPSKPNSSATDLARLDHITAQAFNNRNERPGLPNSGLPNKTDPPKTVLASEEFNSNSQEQRTIVLARQADYSIKDRGSSWSDLPKAQENILTAEKPNTTEQAAQTTLAQNKVEGNTRSISEAAVQATGETLAHNSTTPSETTGAHSTTGDALSKENSAFKAALAGLGINVQQGPIGTDVASWQLDKQAGAQLPLSNQLLAHLFNQDSASNNVAGSIPERLASILNYAQPGMGLLARDNSVALSGQPALISPFSDPLNPLFLSSVLGKDTQNNSPLSVKESPGNYVAATGLTNGNPLNGSPASGSMHPNSLMSRDGQALNGTTNSQTIAQALAGLLQQGQGAVKSTDETGKPIAKGIGGPNITDVIAPIGTGKIGAVGAIEGSVGPLIPLGPLVTKGGKGLEGTDDGKLPIGQVANPTATGLIVTATAGVTVPAGTATGTTTTTTGSPGATPGTGSTTGKDPNATDIKSLVDELPEVDLFDSKKEEEKETTEGRLEVNYETIDDDNDDFINQPVIEGKRASSASGAQSKPSAKVGLSIIENIMVLMNDLKNKKLEDKTAQQMLLDLFSDIFSQEKRHEYIVREDETLENIARYLLKDARLAALLYTINVHAKNIAPVKGEENQQNIYAIKPIGQTILLPHRSEILRYKIHVLKDKQALTLYARGTGSMESPAFTAYVCREDDTLQSVAESHVDIKDAHRWGEIALLNGLSVRVDKSGKPIAKLKAGQELKIPKSVEEEEYDDEPLMMPPMEGMSASQNFAIHDGETVEKTLATMEKRIISQSNLGEQNDSLLMSLELKQGSNRINVAQWDINPTSSTLKLFNRSGGCKIIPIALPTRAARELAENDLKVNADRYCQMFLTGELAA